MTDHLLQPGLVAVLDLDRRFGLTRALAARPSTDADLARDLGLDPRATRLVLDALAAAGQCHRRPDGTWARDPAPTWPWSALDAFLTRGELAVDLDDPETRDRAYATAVVELAAREDTLSRALAGRLPVATHVLDIGAGAGPWSLAQAERHPDCRVTALDRPEVLPRFLEAATRRGLSARVDTLAGSWDDPMPEARFDRVVLANVLHLLPADDAARLVGRAARTLRPGGDIVVIDCLPRGDRLDALVCATYALHLGVRTRRGGVHPLAAIRSWCRAAGLGHGHVYRPGGEPGLGALRVW
jgi:SAM-dependent methyltransferase